MLEQPIPFAASDWHHLDDLFHVLTSLADLALKWNLQYSEQLKSKLVPYSDYILIVLDDSGIWIMHFNLSQTVLYQTIWKPDMITIAGHPNTRTTNLYHFLYKDKILCYKMV
jgi:hypothetical protein